MIENDPIPEKDVRQQNTPEPEILPTSSRRRIALGAAPNTDHPAAEQAAAIVHAQMEFSGPLPHPQTLRQYDEVLPGAAERIMRMAEKQQEHRIGMDGSEVRRANWGLGAGYSLSVLGLISSAFLILHGHELGGSVLGGSTFLSLVTTFVYGSNSRRDESLRMLRQLTSHSNREEDEQIDRPRLPNDRPKKTKKT